MIIRSSRILTGWRSPTKFFMPDEMELLADRVKYRQREWLGLRKLEESIHIDRIASVRIQAGLILATVNLETFGGAKADLRIESIAKGQAQQFRDKLQQQTEMRARSSEHVSHQPVPPSALSDHDAL